MWVRGCRRRVVVDSVWVILLCVWWVAELGGLWGLSGLLWLYLTFYEIILCEKGGDFYMLFSP